ncbi:MAG: AAA family ATPase, partial [Clostridiales bacterium]|nr:AAA family ATPase [Clostridiales bacterium]
MKTIVRTKYLDKMIELNGTPDIKIITGIRRSGKSILMQAYIEYLKNHFVNINIIFVDFMDLAYEGIKEYHALHTYIEEHYQEGKINYLFVDEVQMCPGFELAINSLYSRGKYDIYITGSNAFLLSADLATLFTGRYIEIHVFPFSFREYCQYFDEVGDTDQLFDEFAIQGGLSGSYAYRTEEDRVNYIKKVYETIVTRDLVQKYSLPDTLVLQRLSEFLMDNISNLT